MLILLHYFLRSIAVCCVDKQSYWAICAVLLNVHTLKELVLRTADNPHSLITLAYVECWFNIHRRQMKTFKQPVPDFSQLDFFMKYFQIFWKIFHTAEPFLLTNIFSLD